MVDKRKHIRVPFSAKARLSAEDTEPVDVAISNLSFGGLLFHTAAVFELGKMVSIHVSGKFKENAFKERVTGRIVAVHRGVAGNSFGIRFITYLTPEKEPALHDWVDSHEGKPIPSFLRSSMGGD
ncbi:MAG: PilZ domain-containing protein [Nitrospiria bacterium]